MAANLPRAPALPPGPHAEERSYAVEEAKKFENLRRRDPSSREYLSPLFDQIAVATVRNALYNSLPPLQSAEKRLADKVAELRVKKEAQLQLLLLSAEGQGSGGDVKLQPAGQDKVNVGSMPQNEELKNSKKE